MLWESKVVAVPRAEILLVRSVVAQVALPTGILWTKTRCSSLLASLAVTVVARPVDRHFYEALRRLLHLALKISAMHYVP
mmetsp:Transcript_108163/g.302975  ORF Transcript_108163/g.302975 Transcript_108163/m.302975 type:complete len:80 (-) Transcript_108163:252-491(-)